MSNRCEEIRTRLDAATRGPWVARHDVDGIRVATQHPEAPGGEFGIVRCAYHSDADLIADAPEDLAWLLARVDLLEEVTLALAAGVTSDGRTPALDDVLREFGADQAQLGAHDD